MGRRYVLSMEGSEHDGQGFYYSVGQPMGALSSWAMLALTHHLIVQYAVRKVYGGLYLGK